MTNSSYAKLGFYALGARVKISASHNPRRLGILPAMCKNQAIPMAWVLQLAWVLQKSRVRYSKTL